ncbi:hypothetical protein Plhal304r1_c025g0084521 [Plasmopara halstedii]
MGCSVLNCGLSNLSKHLFTSTYPTACCITAYMLLTDVQMRQTVILCRSDITNSIPIMCDELENGWIWILLIQ